MGRWPRLSIGDLQSSILDRLSSIHPLIPSSEVLNHQEAVVAAGVVARHPANDLVSEVQIEPLCSDVRCAHFEADGRYSTAKEALFDLMHQAPAVSETSMFRCDPQRDYVPGAVGLNHSDDKGDHLIARRDDFM